MKTLTLILIPGFGICQVTPTTFDQNVVPPSPEAQSFLKSGIYPVDHSTGVPKIEIPFYEIKSGSLSLPVGLSYHASGIRINELAGSVGLGWSLNAGGMVSRVINQIEDEQGFLHNDHHDAAYVKNFQPLPRTDPQPFYATVYNYLKEIAFGNQDGRSDDYSFAVGNTLSGQFVYDINKNLRQRSFTNNIIKRNADETFEITGEDGTHYIFNEKENVRSIRNGYCPSSWLIKKIYSSDYKDSISFEYNHFPGFYYTIESQTYDNNNTGSSVPDAPAFDKHYASIDYDQIVLVKKISFKNGSVTFDYEGGRKDLMSHCLSAVSINVINNAGTEVLLKKFQLLHSYFQVNSKPNQFEARLRLDGISNYDGKNNYVNSYKFHYNAELLPPMINQANPSGIYGPTIGCAEDLWGYYNGQTNNIHLLPDLDIEGLPRPDRSAHEQYMKAESLESIDFPTGGNTRFEMEANRIINFDGSVRLLGGLRVARTISTASADAIPVIKQYIYDNPNIMSTTAALGNYQYLQHIDWKPITGPANNIDEWYGKVVYFSDPIIPMANHRGAPVFYDTVTELMDNGTADKQKTIFYYDFEPDREYSIPQTGRFGDAYYSDRSWARGGLLKTSYYVFRNGDYHLSKDISNQYDVKQASQINVGLYTYIQLLHTLHAPDGIMGYSNYLDPPDHFDFNYFDIYEDAGIKKVIGTQETDYDDNGNVTTNNVSSIAYSSQEHLFPTQKTQTSSDGSQRLSLYKYPMDFRGQAPYDEMISKNMLSPTIQVQTYKNSTANFLSSQKTNYASWINGVIAPVSQDVQVGAGPVRTEMHLSNYDNSGNLLGYQKLNGPYVSYQWGYNNTYPVVEIKNARNSSTLAPDAPGETDLGFSNERGDNNYIVDTEVQKMQFTVGATGSVDLSTIVSGAVFSGQVNLPCTLTGPNSYSKSFTLMVMGYTPVPSSMITLPGLLPGNYTLSVSASFYTTPNVPYSVNLAVKYPLGYSAVKEFYSENFEDIVADTEAAHTGRKCIVSPHTVSWTPPNNRSYVISYWYKSGGIWQYQADQPYTGSSYALTGGTAYDDVRIYPSDAQMTTYTYDPLVGMTSSIDEKGKTTYYEYDDFQRLKNVRDQDGNIIKRNTYHYKN